MNRIITIAIAVYILFETPLLAQYDQDYYESVKNASEFINEKKINGPILSNLDIAYYSNIPFYNLDFLFTKERLEKIMKNKTSDIYAVYRTNSLIQKEVENYFEENCEKIKEYKSNNITTIKIHKC